MTDLVPKRAPAALLGALALFGLLVRLWPFLSGSALAYPMDYDEGVYFSAAGLLARGVLPYRDFVFVHPPGLLWFLATSAAWPADPSRLFALSRFIAAGLGGASVYLAGRTAQRAGGLLAGAVAALLYALYPEAVGVERGPFLEPVLNLACLAFAAVWLGNTEDGKARRPLLAGALLGVSVAVKVWAGAWVIAGLASLPRKERSRAALQLALGAVAAYAVLVLPLALRAPRAFVTQTLLFHALRPKDGTPAGVGRMLEMVHVGHRVAPVLAAVALLSLPWRVRRGDGARTERLFVTAWLVTLLGFLLSSSYWRQYNAALAGCEAVLAGLGAQALWNALGGRARPLRVVGLIGLALGLRRPLREVRHDAAQRMPEQPALARLLHERVPPDACLFALEPGWGVLGGRWPKEPAGAPLVVDSYGAQLLAAAQTGARYPDTGAAFADSSSQAPVRPLLVGCDYLVLGGRGEWQLSAESRATAAAGHAPLPGPEGLPVLGPRR